MKDKLYRVPSKTGFVVFVLCLLAICALFPLATCLDFGAPPVERETASQCGLSYMKRLGQTAPLMAFVGTLIALFPLRQASRIRHNKRQGGRIIKHLESRRDQATKNGQHALSRRLSRKLGTYGRYYRNAKNFGRVEAIAFVATVIGVMEVGS